MRNTLTIASEAGRLTAAERYRYRRSLRLAMGVVRTLDLPAKAQRRDELGSQIVMLATLASRGKLTPRRMQPLFRQLDANRVWFGRSAPPKRLAQVSVPGDPLVYAYYPGHGLQFQPLFNWTKVNGYWFAKDYAGMQALIDELAPLAVPQQWRLGLVGVRVRLPGVARALAERHGAGSRDPGPRARVGSDTRRPRPRARTTRAAGPRSPNGGRWPAGRVGARPLVAAVRRAPVAARAQRRPPGRDLPLRLRRHHRGCDSAGLGAGRCARGGRRAAEVRHRSMEPLPPVARGRPRLPRPDDAQLRQLALKSGDPVFRDYADRFAVYRVTPPVIAAATDTTTRAYPSVDDSPRAAVRVDARLNKISRVTLVVTDAAGSTVAASRLGTHRRGLVKVRWNAHVRSRPAVPGDYQLWLTATDLAGNRSSRTPVGVAAVERDTERPAVRVLRVGRADGNVRLRWASTDNASRHLRIKVSVAGRTAMLRGVPLRGRRTLALSAPAGAFTAWITVTDESGNAVTFKRRSP